MTVAYDESVHEAVARETARRKRVFLAFMGLLLIPIAICGYVLTRAKTEVERVAADVTPIVTSRVAGEITTRVTNDVATKTEPLIRENVAREITVVESRLSSVSKDITQLQETTQKTSELVRSVTPQLTAVPELTKRLSAFDANQARLTRDMGASLQSANSNKEALAAISSQLAVMNRELRALQVRVKALENKRQETPVLR